LVLGAGLVVSVALFVALGESLILASESLILASFGVDEGGDEGEEGARLVPPFPSTTLSTALHTTAEANIAALNDPGERKVSLSPSRPNIVTFALPVPPPRPPYIEAQSIPE
jgi:hypothetical protein